MDEPTTTELVRLALERDSRAWATLIERFRRVVWAATYGFGLDRDTRDDVFQLTWLRLLDKLAGVRDPERLAGWLATTARRECIAVLRVRVRTQPFDDVGGDVAATAPELDSGLIRSEDVRSVARALDEIDARCRQLLRLLVAEPALTYSEISIMLEIPIGSIGPTRARCLEKLGRRPSIVRISAAIAPSERQEEIDD